MSAFAYTQLEDGEVMVIGPVVFSSTGGVSFGAGGGPTAQVSRTSQRRVGITNRRVVVEPSNPQDCISIPNLDIRRVYVRRENLGSKIEKIETTQGQTVKLDLGGLRPVDEARLFDIFPNAEIGQKKGLFGGFVRLTPQSIPASPRPAPPRQGAPSVARPSPVPPAMPGLQRSHIDDADIQSLDDLQRYYPLSPEYEYVQNAQGDYVVQRLSDGAQFLILVEEDMLGFDVPIQDPKRRKITVEVFKQL